MNKLMTAGAISAFALMMSSTASALDYSKVTGAEIVQENAVKQSGYTSAQKKELISKLVGRELTFENGEVTSVTIPSFGGKVKVSMKFGAPGGNVLSPSFYIDAVPGNAQMESIAKALDGGAKIKKVSGKVAKDEYTFTLESVTLEPVKMPSLEAEYDPKSITGLEIVKFNASKNGGLTAAKKKLLINSIVGRELTFENGEVTSVNVSSFDKKVKVSVKFSAPGGGILSPTFYLDAVPSDAQTQKIAKALSSGAKIKSVKGKVTKDEYTFTLEDVQIVPESMPTAGAEYDPSTITGAEIVKMNAAQKSGLSSAKKKELISDMVGRELTFENGEVTSVTIPSFGGKVKVSMKFGAPGGNVLSPSFYIDAVPGNAQMESIAKALDGGAKIKKVSGKVAKDEYTFTLESVTLEPVKMPSLEAEYDPKSITGLEIVKFNASKNGGLTAAKKKLLINSIVGRELTFENGEVTSVNVSSFDKKVKVSVKFSAPGGGILSPTFYLDAIPVDAEKAKEISSGTKVKSLTGKVAKDEFTFTLEGATLVL